MKFSKDDEGNNVVQFASVLTKISDDTKQNTNKKNYKYVTLKFKDVNGKEQISTGIIYEGNYSKGVVVGKSYLTTARIVGKDAFLQMSHLEATENASSDMFGFKEVAVESKVKVKEKSLEDKED